MPEPIDLSTPHQVLITLTWIMDRELDLESGQALSQADARRALGIARAALLRLPIPAPEPVWVDAALPDLPAWLLKSWEEFDAQALAADCHGKLLPDLPPHDVADPPLPDGAPAPRLLRRAQQPARGPAPELAPEPAEGVEGAAAGGDQDAAGRAS